MTTRRPDEFGLTDRGPGVLGSAPSGAVVVRWPNWVGDAVMATPVGRALAASLPGSEIWILGRSSAWMLLRGLPWVAGWIEYDKARHGGPLGAWRLSRELAHRRFAAALILPNSFSSALVPFLARVPERAGYLLGHRGFLLTSGIRPEMEGRRRRPEPMPRYYLRLTRLLVERLAGHSADDACFLGSSAERLELRVTSEEGAAAREHLGQLGIEPGEPYAAINPGASFGPSKLWSVAGFAEVARGLHERRGLRSLVLCGPGEETLARDIARRAGRAAIDTSAAMIPLDLLKPVLRGSRLLITTDTGPRHIAVALGVPVIVVMGSTDPRYTACNLEATEVLRVDVDCGPCHKKVCPERTHRCMEGISPQWALRAAESLLERHPAPRVSSSRSS
jgi:heptosyltransferase-2